MKTEHQNKRLGLLISFCLILAVAFSPLNIFAEEIQEEPTDEKSTCSFLRQDEIGLERPFQAQIMVSGNGKGENRSFNPAAAVHLGYRFSELLYFGWTSQTFFNENANLNEDEDKRYDDETVYGQEGARETTVKTDPRHLLEMRFFPWRFGLYFSAGIMHYGEDKVTTEYKNRPRIINENEYTTGMRTTLEYEAWTGAAAGIGFSHTFGNGFTLSSGLNLGLGIQKPEVTIETSSAVAAADLAEWQEQIETNEKRVPTMFHFGVGYAF